MHFLNFGLLCSENQGQIPWNSKEDEATQKRKEKQAFYSVTNFFLVKIVKCVHFVLNFQ